MADAVPVADEDLGIDDPEQYNRETRERLQRALDEHTDATPREQRSLLDDIRETVAEEGEPTETLEFGDEAVEVRATLPGAVLDAYDTAMDVVHGDLEPEEARFGDLRDTFIDANLAMVVDGPPEVTDRAEYERLYERDGPEALADTLVALTRPARERTEAMDKFRGERRGGGATPDV